MNYLASLSLILSAAEAGGGSSTASEGYKSEIIHVSA